MLGGAGLGGFLLMGYSWRFVFQFVSVAAVLCAGVLIFLIPAAAPHSLTSEDGASHADYCITVPRDNRPKVGLVHRAAGQPAAAVVPLSHGQTATSRCTGDAAQGEAILRGGRRHSPSDAACCALASADIAPRPRPSADEPSLVGFPLA